jgi:hypothetical protein
MTKPNIFLFPSLVVLVVSIVSSKHMALQGYWFESKDAMNSVFKSLLHNLSTDAQICLTKE